jgi:hypothetical protein
MRMGPDSSMRDGPSGATPRDAPSGVARPDGPTGTTPDAAEAIGPARPHPALRSGRRRMRSTALDPTKERSSDQPDGGTRPAAKDREEEGLRTGTHATAPTALVLSSQGLRTEAAKRERLTAPLEAAWSSDRAHREMKPWLRKEAGRTSGSDRPDLRVLASNRKEPLSAAHTLREPSGTRATANVRLCDDASTRPSGRVGATERRRERRRPIGVFGLQPDEPTVRR